MKERKTPWLLITFVLLLVALAVLPQLFVGGGKIETSPDGQYKALILGQRCFNLRSPAYVSLRPRQF